MLDDVPLFGRIVCDKPLEGHREPQVRRRELPREEIERDPDRDTYLVFDTAQRAEAAVGAGRRTSRTAADGVRHVTMVTRRAACPTTQRFPAVRGPCEKTVATDSDRGRIRKG